MGDSTTEFSMIFDMRKKIIPLTLILILFCGGAFAVFVTTEKNGERALASSKKLSVEQRDRLREIMNDLIFSTHRSLLKEKKGEMKPVKIKIKPLNDPAYYMESNFGIGRAIFGLRRYKIGVNPVIFELGIPHDALVGVLAHELVHTEDYEGGSTLGTLIPLGLSYLNRDKRIQYERKTDLKVIMKGLGSELKAYRQWQYPTLGERDLKMKKKEYLTPQEIDFLMMVRQETPKCLKNWLEGEIPLLLEAFEMSYESCLLRS